MKTEKETLRGRNTRVVKKGILLLTGIVIALFIGLEFIQRHIVAFFQSLILGLTGLLLTGSYWTSVLPQPGII